MLVQAQPPQQKIFIQRIVVRDANPGIGMEHCVSWKFPDEHDSQIGSQIVGRSPFQQILLGCGRHARCQLSGGLFFDGVQGSQHMRSPSGNRHKTAHVGECVANRPQDGLADQFLPARKPGLQDAMGFQVLFGQFVKFRGV